MWRWGIPFGIKPCAWSMSCSSFSETRFSGSSPGCFDDVHGVDYSPILRVVEQAFQRPSPEVFMQSYGPPDRSGSFSVKVGKPGSCPFDCTRRPRAHM